MDAKSVTKVGILVLIAIPLGVYFWFRLAHINPNTYTIRVSFKDTKGLLRQSVVRMQGVSIGEVQKVELDTSARPPRPLVTLIIDKNYGIPVNSRFRVVSGILITNPQIEIEPGTEPGFLPNDNSAQITGVESGGPLEAFSPELQKTVEKVNGSFDALQTRFTKAADKIDKILDKTDKLLATINDAASTGKNLIADPQLKNSLKNTISNFEQTSKQIAVTAGSLSKRLDDITATGKTSLEKLTGNLSDILTQVDTTLEDANAVVKKLTETVTDPRLQNTLQETADLARTTLARFNQIASDLHQITGDPQLQNNLKQTVQNLQNATEQGEQAVQKINNLLGKLTGGTGAASQIRLPQVQLVGNLSEQFDPSNFRADLEARVSTGGRNLFNLGLFDFGGNTRLILQGGSRYSDQFLLRYGLYASKLGVGAEYTPRSGVGFRADFWDINRPQLDLRALFRVNRDASLWVGADGLFRGDPSPRIGIQFSR